MDVRQLEIFIRVAQLCSFSKAADAMDVSQSVLSRQIRQLEAELGIHLLYRNGRGCMPTEAGKRFLTRALGILRQVDAAREDVRERPEDPTGQVIVGLPPRTGGFLTGPLVSSFIKKFPLAHISIAEAPTPTLFEWLTLGRVDIGLLNNPPIAPHLQYEEILSEELYLVSPPSTIKRVKRTVPLRRLSEVPLILPCRPNTIRNLIDSECSKHGLKLNVVLEIDPIAGIVDLVKRGLGCAVLTATTIPQDEINLKRCAAKIVSPPIVNRFYIGTSADRLQSNLIRQTIDLIKMELFSILRPVVINL